MSAGCQCEHEDHFDGGPGHPYADVAAGVHVERTPFGSFRVCDDCVGHMGDAGSEPEIASLDLDDVLFRAERYGRLDETVSSLVGYPVSGR